MDKENPQETIKINESQSQTDKFKKELYHVVDQIFPPLAIRYLLVLQSSFPMPVTTGKPNPEVFSKILTIFNYDILTICKTEKLA